MSPSEAWQVQLTLPYPPTVNHYWGRKGSRSYLTTRARAFREEVALVVLQCGVRRMKGCLALDAIAHPPDRRRRDIDNLLKGLLDALQHAGVFADDQQVIDLRVKAMPYDEANPARVVVWIRETGG